MSMLILMTVFARKRDVDKVGHTSESRGPDRSFLVPCNVGARFKFGPTIIHWWRFARATLLE